MKKKMLIIPIVVITLVAFGTVSSAHAIVSLTSLTVALAAGFLTTVLAADGIKRTKAELAQKKAKTQDAEKKTNEIMHVSGLNAQVSAEAK
jgi:uncharacterized membrane protein (DUF441 family)